MEKKNHKKLKINAKTLYQFTDRNINGLNVLPDTTTLTVTATGIMAK